MTSKDVLIVKHLPSELSDDDKQDFFSHFGAVATRLIDNQGYMKNCAFVTFDDEDAAANAMSRLHQLNILGCTLTAEYSKKCHERHHPHISDTFPDTPKSSNDKTTNNAIMPEDPKDTVIQPPPWVNIANKWGFNYPLNPSLKYLYPEPDSNIIANISHALIAVPKFYVQVLHLMNKMCLPAPFGPVTAPPPLQHNAMTSQSLNNLVQGEMDISSSDESEIESSGEGEAETKSKKRPLKDPKRPKKKHKLQHILSAPKLQAAIVEPTDVFEKVQPGMPKMIAIKLSETKQDISQIPENIPSDEIMVEMGGFGKIEPQKKDEAQQEETVELWDKSKFINSEDLKNGCISKSQWKDYSVFKNYTTGEVTTRLYIKNLAKSVTEEDVHFIYGRYVNWSSELEENMFDVLLMKQGRMKGQAFVTLPNERVSEKACKDTNGYVLQGKPMVVQFARSAKPKDS